MQGQFGSEMTFVPRSTRRSEDDGWLLVFVHDVEDRAVYLEIFDALNIADGPRAKLALPQRVPIGFHTTWISHQRFAG